MPKLPEHLNSNIKRIYLETKPVSIFLYGSRARADFVDDSDYEIGLLYNSDNKIPRHLLAKRYPIKNVRLYPFDYQEFIDTQLDTPFPKVVYMRSLVESAKTLLGQKVLENMALPRIGLIDLLEEATFQIARAYAAMLSEREGDKINANPGFIKSCLFGTRCLIVLRNNIFPTEYNTIVQLSESLTIESGYHELIKHTLEVRSGSALNVEMLFKNISYLNKVVIKEIKDSLQFGNKIII